MRISDWSSDVCSSDLYGPEARPPIVPPELEGFVFASIGFGAGFAVAGFVALWGARRPGWWAAISAGTPVAILAVAYWRLADFELDLRWAVLGLLLALAPLGARTRFRRYRDRGLAAAPPPSPPGSPPAPAPA